MNQSIILRENNNITLIQPEANTIIAVGSSESGPVGPQGIQGPVGPANTLSKGTVTTGAAGSSADISITGTAPSQTLNMTIPTGATGITVGASAPADTSVLWGDTTVTSTGGLLSAGGTTNQSLVKSSSTDYATKWSSVEISDGVKVTKVDGTGVVTLPVQTTAPSSPSTDTAIIWARNRASRSIPVVQSSNGIARSLAAVPMDKAFALLTPGTATFRQHGIGAHTISTTTTTVTPDANIGYFGNIANTTVSTVSGQAITVSGTSTGIFRRGSSGDNYGGFFAHSRCYFPDASYDSVSSTTGSRLNALLLYANGGSPNTLSRAGTISLCGFQRENSGASGITDTTWKFITCDGTTTSVQETNMSFVSGASGTGKVYDFWIWCPLGSSTIYWQVDDITGNTTQSGSTGSNIPAANTLLACTSGFGNLDTSPGSTRNMRIGRLYVETDKG